MEECEHVPYYIGLNVVVRAVRQEVCYSSRAKSIVRREVLPDDGDRFFDVGIRQKWPEALRRISDPYSTKHIGEIVGILVRSAVPECQSLEDEESTRSADPYSPCGLFAGGSATGYLNLPAVCKGKVEARCDQGGEALLKVAQCTPAIAFFARRDEEIDSYRTLGVEPPTLIGHITLIVDIRGKSGVSQPGTQLLVSLLLQNGQCKPQIQIPCSKVCVQSYRQLALVNQQRRRETTNDNKVIE